MDYGYLYLDNPLKQQVSGDISVILLEKIIIKYLEIK